MALGNILTPVDVYAIVNDLVHQATGQSNLAAVDTSTFITVGETLLQTGPENTLNALANVLGRTRFSVRPYRGKFDVLRMENDRWGAMTRKIVPLTQDAEQTESYNTDIAPTQLADGNSIDHYKIKKPAALQLNFCGSKVVQNHITRFVDQLYGAFRGEDEFAAFVEAYMQEYENDIEQQNEEERRALVLNAMAGIADMGLTFVDLAAEYNAHYGTTYTRAQLLSTYFDSFMKFFAATVKTWSNKLTDRTMSFHANLSAYKPILRHTPKDRQKMLMFSPLFTNAESNVYSGLFNPQYLNIGDFEEINYWQAQDHPEQINIKPNILNVNTGESQIAAAAVNLEYVVGLLFDEEALAFNEQFYMSSVTPLNSAGLYWNIYNHSRFNGLCDYTENMVLFVIGAGGS